MTEDRTARWEARYREGNLPWDTGKPDRHLLDLVHARPVAPCRVLEVGCGTGTNAIWLAQNGFAVTAIDLAPSAIERAREKATEAGVQCQFLAQDFLVDTVPGDPFALAYDRGVLHSLHEPAERARFAAQMAAHLAPSALWLSQLGSTDGPPREVGPPRRSARDVTAAVEEHFEILTLQATHFESIMSTAPRAWYCLLRKRDYPPQASTREGDLRR